MKKVIALAGNPNSGKTTLFNELTGSNQYVGNWPGVTVDRKSGQLTEHEDVELQDLPGIYSLSPYTPEEVVARRYLLKEKPDMLINVVDATNLERNLYLTSQLLETGLPMVVALNMIDLAEADGHKIDSDALSRHLGCPVIKVSALTQLGVNELLKHILADAPAPPSPLHYIAPVEDAVEKVHTLCNCPRFEAVKLLEGDAELLSSRSKQECHAIEEQRLHVEAALEDDIASIIAGGRYDAICAFIPEVMTRQTQREKVSTKVDAVLTHRFAGPLIFVGVMYSIYYLSINTVGAWGTDWANDVLFGPVVGGWLAGFIGDTAASAEAMTMFSAILGMILLFPAMLRRLHDLGMNGAWLYLPLAPFVLENICPHLPDSVHNVLMWALYAANALLWLSCAVLPGKKAPNSYGRRTRTFFANPFKMNGRSSRVDFLVWMLLLSAAAYGFGMLGTLKLQCSAQLQSIISDGIVAGVGAVLGFLPQMAVLFFLMALLEDCGYMARVAFMMDRIFRTIGLSGKSVIPLLVSMGCGVPGVMATRTIENEKDRRMTIMLTTFVPCGAKLPILALIGAMIGQSAGVATIAYFAGIGSVILGGLMLRKTHMFAGSYTPFVMELPEYHTPRGININMRAMERCKSFVKKAGTVIFLASAIIWTLSNYSWNFTYLPEQENLEGAPISHGMLADTGNAFAPLFEPLGWGDWKPAVATITGFIAKENVVATLGLLYPAPEDDEQATEDAPTDELPRTADIGKANALSALTMALWQTNATARDAKPVEIDTAEEEEDENAEAIGVAANVNAAGAFTALSAVSFLLFNILCAPCFAACGAIRREMNSARWTWLAIGFMCIWAYIVSFCTYQIGTLCITGDFGTGALVACILLLCILVQAVRSNPNSNQD
ncbi:MAG: 50S ribosome-binding GTPase [Akkermansia sp.]|nr:50S ribosome-binding GTPase [Akkermansia sp.]